MRSKLGDKVRLQHILDAIQEIESYLVDVDFEKFMENSMMRYACIKLMEIIGEASNYVFTERKLRNYFTNFIPHKISSVLSECMLILANCSLVSNSSRTDAALSANTLSGVYPLRAIMIE